MEKHIRLYSGFVVMVVLFLLTSFSVVAAGGYSVPAIPVVREADGIFDVSPASQLYNKTAYPEVETVYPKLSPCYNGVHDLDETGIDCGGSCEIISVGEICDGEDNDKDCLVDEEDICVNSSAVNVEDVPGSILAAEISSDETQEQDVVVLENETEQIVVYDEPAPLVTYEAEEVGDVLTSSSDRSLNSDSSNEGVLPVVPSVADKGSLDDLQFTAFRQWVKDKGIYLPSVEEESHKDFYGKYQTFIFSHKDELEAKYNISQPDDEETLEIFRWFSEETYAQPDTLKPGILIKIVSFFAGLFG